MPIRRLVFVFMMLLLPLQWSWAAAGSVCAHEAGGTHFGHHEHRHEAASHADAAAADADASGLLGNHPDCEACHGLGAGHVAVAGDTGPDWSAGQRLPAYTHHLPEPPLESLLRPPLSLVA